MVLAVGLLELSNAFATCEKWEYAKLKDASKTELIEEYCYAQALTGPSKSIWEARRRLDPDGQDTKDARKDYFGCLDHQQDLSNMLQKKYKAKSSPVCKPRQ